MDKASGFGIAALWSFSGLSRSQIFGRILFYVMILSALIIGSICVWNAAKWINKPFGGFLLNERMIVGHTGQYHWTGVQAGLKRYDKVIRANDREVSSMKDLEEVINGTRVGDLVTYTVKRGGQTFEADIPTMLFSGADFLMIFGVFFLMGILYVSIGLIVFFLKQNTTIGWVFMLACFIQGISYFTTFDIESSHYGFVRAYIFNDAFLPAVILHLSLLFPEQTRLVKRHTYIQIFPYIISLAMAVPLELFYPRPLFITIYNFILIYFSISIIALISASVISFFRKASALARQRAKVLLSGLVLALPLPTAAMLAASMGGTLGGWKIITNFSAIPTVIFPMSVAYAIAKHNLFDVDVYIKRAVGYGIMTAIVGLTYFSLQLVLRELILTPLLGDSAERVYPILFALLVVFLFNPVNRRIQGSIDKLFYRKKIDYKDTVLAISNTLTSVLNLNELIEWIINTLRKEMFIDRAGVIILEPEKECKALFVGDSPGAAGESLAEQCLQFNDPLITLLASEKKIVTRYDIEEDIRYSEVRESCSGRFSEMGASIAIPFMYQDEVTGILTLGNKKSGHFYSREDIDLLETLSNQGAIAIKNAKLFKENLEKGRMEEELKIAHDLQTSMLPEKAPTIKGVQIAASSTPAREVGGDFYDFIEIKGDGTNDKLGIVVADVSGKAVSGALVMAASRSVFRVLSETLSSVEDIMKKGNARLKSDVKKGMFVALLYAVLDPVQKIITLSNAGQTQPILCSGSSAPAYIDTEGDRFPLGIVKMCDYKETSIDLKNGDTIILYTDGVVEAMNGDEEMYGFDRFMASINEGRELAANALLEKLVSDVSRFVGDTEQHDDLTIAVVKVEE